MFKVMALDLWRDRAAMAMAFFLPSLVFLIFSAVFSGTTGLDVKLKVAIADMAHTKTSSRLSAALMANHDLRAQVATPATIAQARALVRSGQIDAGIVIQSDPMGQATPLLILSDPTRAIAGPLTEARVRETMSRSLPDVVLDRTVRDVGEAIGPLTDDQRDSLSMAEGELIDDPKSGARTPPLFAFQEVAGAHKGGGSIAYYAGAVSILFALFSAMHGALTLIEERRSGIADRILAGRAGMGPVVTGKFLFLVVQAVVQAVAIFATAQIVYGVPVAQHLGLWLVTTTAAAVCSGGLALGLVAVCRTRDQAQMLSTFVILILAAVGGSMVPRFLMPPWLQTLGWFTPHAWVIDAYEGLLWRDDGAGVLYKAWIVMGAFGAVGLAVAQLTARRVRV